MSAVGLGLQPLSPALASIGQALIIGIAVARFIVDPSMRTEVAALVRRPGAWLGLAVVAWSLLALLWSPDPGVGLHRGLMIRAALTTLALAPILVRPWPLVTGLAMGVGVEAVVQLLMFTGLVPDEHYEPMTISGGLSKHPGNIAVWAGVAGLLLVGRWASSLVGPKAGPPASGDSRPRGASTAILVVLALASVVVAGNRSLLVGLPIAVALLAFAVLARISRRARRLACAGLGCLVLLGIVVPSVAPDLPPVQRVRDLVREVSEGLDADDAGAADTSGGLRMLWWRESVVILQDAPLIGHGSGSTRTAFDRHLATLDPETVPERAYTDNPHSSIAFELVEHGLVGAFLAAGFVVAMLVASVGRMRRDPSLAGLPAAWFLLLAYAAGNTVQLSMYPLTLAAFLAALTLARCDDDSTEVSPRGT